MGLVGGERVERARHPDGTPRTDRLGRRLPLTPRGSPLAIRPKEQRTREVPACGVASPGPRPGPATLGLLLGLWRDLVGGWCWSASPARRTCGRPGHANLPVFRQRFISRFEDCICTRMYRLVCRFLSRFRQTVQRADACRPTRSGLRVPTLDRVDSLLAVRCSVGSQLPALRDQLATAREGMEHCFKRL
jgi:hypothetical protein